MSLSTFLTDLVSTLSVDTSDNSATEFDAQLSDAAEQSETNQGKPLTAHFINYLDAEFSGRSGSISRSELKEVIGRYISTFEDDPSLSTQDRDKINYLRNASTKDVETILKRFDEYDKKLSSRDILLAGMYANNSQEKLDAEGIRSSVFSDIQPYVAKSPDALGPAPTPIPQPEEEIGLEERDTRVTETETSAVDAPQDKKEYKNDPDKLHIVPGDNPDKVTIYYYDTQNERYYNAFYQSGDEISSTKIFIKSDHSLETIDQALGYYAQSQFGDSDHVFENIVFAGHGSPNSVTSSSEHNDHELDLFDLWTTLDKYTDNLDMSSCQILCGYGNYSDQDNYDFLNKKINFADEHDLNIKANSILSYQSWASDELDGPGGRPYLLTADGDVLRIRQLGDDYMGGYVDDPNVRIFVGSHMEKIWQDKGGEYAIDHEAVEQQLKTVKWSQKSIDQM